MFNSTTIAIINRILHSNEGSVRLLQQHYGKSFVITMPFLSLHAQIDSDGLLIPPTGHETSTVVISIPLATATYLIDRDKLATFKHITCTGDADFGRKLLEIFSNLNIAAFYGNESPTTLYAIAKLRTIITIFKQTISLLAHNASQSVVEYLLYETEDLITQYEMDEFCSGVDDLTERVNRLNAQINLFIKRSPC